MEAYALACPILAQLLGRTKAYSLGPTGKAESIDNSENAMPRLSRSRLTKGKRKSEEFKRHKADAKAWGETAKLKRVDSVNVATILNSYEILPTGKNDAMPQIVANFVRPWMMKTTFARLEVEGLLSTTQIHDNADQDLRTLMAKLPRDEAESSEDQEAAVTRLSVREAERESDQGTGVGEALTGKSLMSGEKVILRLFSIKRERS